MSYRVKAILCHDTKPDVIFDAEMAFDTWQQAFDWMNDDCQSEGFFDFKAECKSEEFSGYWLDDSMITDENNVEAPYEIVDGEWREIK